MGVCLYTKRSFYMRKGINVSNRLRDQHAILTKVFIQKRKHLSLPNLHPSRYGLICYKKGPYITVL